MTQETPKIAFLLGAGASVDAGCPTVYALVASYRDFVARRGTRPEIDALDFVMQRLHDFAPIKTSRRVLDVELLLSTLQLLIERQSNPIAAFTKNWVAGLRKVEVHLPRLLSLLEQHIRVECTVN